MVRQAAVLGAIVVLVAAPRAWPEPVRARSAAEFLDTIGVNTHLGTTEIGAAGTTYNSLAAVSQELAYIGVKHARDALQIGGNLPKLATLHATLGVKFDLVYDDYSKSGGRAVVTAALANLASAPQVVEAIEGPNEPDWFGITFDGATKADGAIAGQKAIYQAVKADPQFASIPVYCLALSYPAPGGMASAIGNISAFCDVATAHPYTQNQSLGLYAPYKSLSLWTSYPASVTAPGRPLVITEGGWTTCPTDGIGVDEATQAKFMLAYLLDAFSLGIKRTYLYELAEEGADPSCHDPNIHYGLFRYDGHPKPAATVLANLRAVLGPASGPPRSLAYTIDGLRPSTGHSLLLQTGLDSFALALWDDALLWDPQKHAAIQSSATVVHVSLEKSSSEVKIYDPLLGVEAQQTSHNVADATVAVLDHPIFLLISAGR